MTHRDKFEFVNELCSTMNIEFARAIWRREGFPLHPCTAGAMLVYTGKHYNVAKTLFLLDAFTVIIIATTLSSSSMDSAYHQKKVRHRPWHKVCQPLIHRLDGISKLVW